MLLSDTQLLLAPAIAPTFEWSRLAMYCVKLAGLQKHSLQQRDQLSCSIRMLSFWYGMLPADQKLL